MDYGNTLNIFSDASLLGKANTITKNKVCAGAVAVINGSRDKEYHCLLDKSTNNYGELIGIYLAIKLANLYKNKYKVINIFSDSNISVYGLREWIYNWINHMDNYGNMYNSSGNKVANQTIIKCIIDFVIESFEPYKNRINILHCASHVNLNSIDDIYRAIRCFSRNFANGRNITKESILFIQNWNNYIDESTRASLTKMQYGVEYFPDECTCIPALYDDRLIYLSYSNIIQRKL